VTCTTILHAQVMWTARFALDKNSQIHLNQQLDLKQIQCWPLVLLFGDKREGIFTVKYLAITKYKYNCKDFWTFQDVNIADPGELTRFARTRRDNFITDLLYFILYFVILQIHRNKDYMLSGHFDPWRWDHNAASKSRENITHWRGVISRKNRHLSYTAA
jgi:hypothetical protein